MSNKDRRTSPTRTGVHVGLFCAAFLLLSWPLLKIVEQHDPGWSLAYAFSLWALMVVVLVLVTFSLRKERGRRRGPRSRP